MITSASYPNRVGVPGVSLPRVVTSEWIKLWSVRSTTIGLALSVIVLIGVGLITSITMGETFATGAELDGPPFMPQSPIEATLGGVVFAQLLIGALGVLSVSAEYATGMVRATNAAVPARLPVLWAKALVFGAVTVGLSIVSVLGSFFAGSAFLSTHDVAPSIADPGVLRALIASPFYLAGVGVLAIALAVLVRSTALAVSIISFVTFMLDSLVETVLPAAVGDNVVPYLPSTAGAAIMSVRDQPGMLDPLPGFAVFCGWLVVALAAAALVLRRRDV